nr:polysaccharide deacetylase family protein [uncultured Tyzzerella sp.]
MKKFKFLTFIIVIVGVIYIIPVTSIGDINKNNQEKIEIVQASVNINNKNNVDEKNIKENSLSKKDNIKFEFKQIEKYEKPLVYKIKYPVFNNKNIEEKINNQIYNLAKDFKNEFSQYEPIIDDEKLLFILNTEIYNLKDNLLFVKFNVERNYNTYPNPVKFYETFIIDLKSENFVNISDILNKNYIDLFYIYVKEYFFNNYGINITKQSENYNDIKPTQDVYKKMFLDDKYVYVFFYDYKKQQETFTKIPLEKLLPYVKEEYLQTTTITETTRETTTQATTFKETTTETTTQTITTTATTTEKTTNQLSSKRKIDKNKPMIALTFDDGPNGAVTNKILDVLEKNNSVATFFIVSRRIEKDAEVLKRMDKLGNQIGNHTANHKDLTKISTEQVKSEVDIVNKKLKDAIGKEASMVRVPYGATNDNVKQAVNSPIVMWNVDTKDWKSRNTQAIVKEVLGKVKDGDIILMHDLYGTTAEACEIIIPKLVEQGYQLVTVEELLYYKGIEVKNGVKYFNGNKK